MLLYTQYSPVLLVFCSAWPVFCSKWPVFCHAWPILCSKCASIHCRTLLVFCSICIWLVFYSTWLVFYSSYMARYNFCTKNSTNEYPYHRIFHHFHLDSVRYYHRSSCWEYTVSHHYNETVLQDKLKHLAKNYETIATFYQSDYS